MQMILAKRNKLKEPKSQWRKLYIVMHKVSVESCAPRLAAHKCYMLVYNKCVSVGDAALVHLSYQTEVVHPHTPTLCTPPTAALELNSRVPAVEVLR